MNLDELFTSVRTMEAGGSTDVGNDVQNLNLECCFNRQSNFSLSQDLSKKTVWWSLEEWWCWGGEMLWLKRGRERLEKKDLIGVIG